MSREKEKYRLLLQNIPQAFAYHEVIFDDKGTPVDYIFLNVNPSFEEMTGLIKENIIGKRVTDVLTGIEDSSFNWISTFGQLVLNGGTIHFEEYSEPLGRYYHVTASAEEGNCFSVIFHDITDSREKEERTKELNFLHGFAKLLRREKNDLEKILQETANILPSSFQDPEKVCARIEVQGSQYKTSYFRLTPWRISSSLELREEHAGNIEVCYLDSPFNEEDPFLKEEKIMLETVAEHLSRVIEQIRAEKALEESENRLNTTLQSIADGVITTDSMGYITRLNLQAEKLTGWTSEEALDRPLDEVFHIVSAQTGEPVYNPVYRVINTGRIEGLANDTTLISREGTRRQIADSAAPILDNNGNIFGVIMVFSDVTEEYRAKEALRKSEERLDAILSNVPAIIYSYKLVDNKTVFTYINENVKNLLGFEPQDFIANPRLWMTLVHPEDSATVQEAKDRGLGKNEQVSIEYRVKDKAGSYLWLHEEQKVIASEGSTEIVAVCWDITARKRAERLIQARLNLITFSYNNPLEAVLQKALDEVCELVDSPIGFYHFVNEDEGSLTLKAWSTNTLKYFCSIGEKSEMQYNIAEAGVWVDCVRERRPVIHNDYFSLPYRRGTPQGHAEVVRELVVPILRHDRIVAILGVGNKPQEYTDHDMEIVSYFADVAWTIVEQKQTEERIRYISFHDTLTGLYNRAFIEEEMKRLDTERQLPISVIMVDLNGLKLVNDTYGHFMGDEMLKTVAAILKDSCRREDVIARWGGDEFVLLLPQTSIKEAESVRKRIKNNCQGVCVENVPVSLALGIGVKDSADRTLLDVLKEAEDNMYRHKLAESRSTRSTVLNALLKTLEAKSYETEEHITCMREVAQKVGEKLGLSDSELSQLSLLITLHDIGNIDISEEILTKKEPLTLEEWEIIKKHPEAGYRIARSTEEFAHVAEDILAHHERWDGAGYPRGLKGKDIPLLARIAAVADAYDIMSSGRPYKEPMSTEEIAAEFKKCAGTQFDPEIVEILLSVLDT